MKTKLWIATVSVMLMGAVSTAVFADVPPYSEDFESGVYGDSLSTLGWRITTGDVIIGQDTTPGWGQCINAGSNPGIYTGGVPENRAFYDFTAPLTTGQVDLSFDAFSVNYQIKNGEFGFVKPEYTAGHPGIRWIGGLNEWVLAVGGDADAPWTYSGGGDEYVHLEISVNLDTNEVVGAITDSTGRHVSPVINYYDATSLTGVGYYNYKRVAWDNFNVDNINVDVVGPPAILLGDANHDGVVSAGDYAAVQSNFGNVGDGILGDANNDGVVSAGDYASVQANFGNVAAATVGTVPEPATMTLLGMTFVGLMFRRRR